MKRLLFQLGILLFFGYLLIHLVHQLIFTSGFSELFLFMFILVALPTWLWIANLDIIKYVATKQIRFLFSTLIGVISILWAVIIYQQVYEVREKPSLLRVYYDGDFNGVGIDFKKNGRFVLDDWAVGISEYSYGSYKISGDTLWLYPDKEIRFQDIHTLIIEPESYSGEDSLDLENYAYPLVKSDRWNTEFRVVEDNREN